MEISEKLGLDTERLCKMCLNTKMLLSNIVGHAAELQYEKYLIKNNISFEKQDTDKHYDYIVEGFRDQVKRYETNGTTLKKISANLTQTHGDRSGEDAFYRKDSFDRLVLTDIGLDNFFITEINNLPRHEKYPNHIAGRFKIDREFNKERYFAIDFYKSMKQKNKEFPPAIENLRKKYDLNYQKLLEKVCNLNLKEIDSLFSEDNFRLVTGIKGFAAEEYFNLFCEKNKIKYFQETNMYSKVDHWLGDLRIQVKFPNLRACTDQHWGVKIHKSHGHGKGELLKKDEFDILALFIGFEIDTNISKYFPVSVENKWLFVPMKDIEEHPKFPGYLKRIPKIEKNKYLINDINFLKSKIGNN